MCIARSKCVAIATTEGIQLISTALGGIKMARNRGEALLPRAKLVPHEWQLRMLRVTM